MEREIRVSGLINEKEKLVDFRQVYLNILGLEEMPDSPAQLPKNLYLPTEFLGSLEDSILKTKDDGRERRQVVKWNTEKNKPIFDKIQIGSTKDISPSNIEFFYTYFGRNKPLLHYHTHPDHTWSFLYSFLPGNQDVAAMAGFPRCSFISIIGNSNGISALAQTRKAERLPVSSIFTVKKIKKDLKNMDTDFSFVIKDYFNNHIRLSKLIESYNFGFYLWRPYSEIKKGSLSNGVVLTRPLG